MKKILALVIAAHILIGHAQAPQSSRAQAMLDSIKLTNEIIIKCQYQPDCMLKAFQDVDAEQLHPYLKDVIKLNIDNLNEQQPNFNDFKRYCSTTWFQDMQQAENNCLDATNRAIDAKMNITQMREDKLACMKTNMQPLIDKDNLFAMQKMINLLGQYGFLDQQDEMRLLLQQRQVNDAAENFSTCQSLYDSLKPKFR